jgi:hypothetical protein
MPTIARQPAFMLEKDNWYISGPEADFIRFIDADLWTALAADSGASVAIDPDGVGGLLLITTGATDNNEAAIATTNELFLFAANKPFWVEGRVQYAEAATDDANIAFGLADAMGANLLSDNGGGDNINSSGALIFKVDGGTVWRFATTNNSVTTETVSQQTAGGSSFQTIRIEVHDDGPSNVMVVPLVDGKYLTDSNNNTIKHRVAVASATEMDYGAYAKAGGGNSEVLTVDYLYAGALR